METTHAVQKADGYDSTLDRPAGDRWIYMSNALIRAGHGLALSEKRLLAIAISKLDSYKQRGLASQVPIIKVSASEYSELNDVDKRTAYEALEKAGVLLQRQCISMYEPEYVRRRKKSGSQDKPTVTRMAWVITAKYIPTEGRIELKFHPDLVPHLIGIQTQFTRYQLKQTTALRSVYSFRLLELLTRFRANGWAEYTIEDFRLSMDAPESFSDFSQLKRRVIDPAIKELQEKDGWQIEMEQVKAGKRVKAVRFNFKRDPQGRLDLNEVQTEQQPEAVCEEPTTPLPALTLAPAAVLSELQLDAAEMRIAQAVAHILRNPPSDV